MKNIKIRIYKVAYQTYLTPYLKVTTSRYLNGNYELILGWFNTQITLLV